MIQPVTYEMQCDRRTPQEPKTQQNPVTRHKGDPIQYLPARSSREIGCTLKKPKKNLLQKMAHHAFLSTDLARFPFRLSTRVKPPSASNNIPHIAEHHHAYQRTHLQRKVRTTRESLPITKASASAKPQPLSPSQSAPTFPPTPLPVRTRQLPRPLPHRLPRHVPPKRQLPATPPRRRLGRRLRARRRRPEPGERRAGPGARGGRELV